MDLSFIFFEINFLKGVLKMTFPKVNLKPVLKLVSDNLPTILTVAAGIGTVVTSILSVKSHMKAEEIICNEIVAREQKYFDEIDELDSDEYDEVANAVVPQEIYEISFKERIALTWFCYWPAITAAAGTLGCIIGANVISLKRQATLAALLAASQTNMKELKEKAKEMIGEKKVQAIHDDVDKDYVRNNPPINIEGLPIMGQGTTLCLDRLIGRYFWGDQESIRKAVNDFNYALRHDDVMSLNDFYTFMNLPGTDIGDKCGWHIETGMLEMRFSSQLSDQSQTPCLVMNYEVDPIVNFR